MCTGASTAQCMFSKNFSRLAAETHSGAGWSSRVRSHVIEGTTGSRHIAWRQCMCEEDEITRAEWAAVQNAHENARRFQEAKTHEAEAVTEAPDAGSPERASKRQRRDNSCPPRVDRHRLVGFLPVAHERVIFDAETDRALPENHTQHESLHPEQPTNESAETQMRSARHVDLEVETKVLDGPPLIPHVTSTVISDVFMAQQRTGAQTTSAEVMWSVHRTLVAHGWRTISSSIELQVLGLVAHRVQSIICSLRTQPERPVGLLPGPLCVRLSCLPMMERIQSCLRDLYSSISAERQQRQCAVLRSVLCRVGWDTSMVPKLMT